MRKLLSYFALYLTGATIAAWLRMFDHFLSLRSWWDLVGLPVMLWVAAILINPLVELLDHWLAFLLANLIYTALAWSWTRYRSYLNQMAATLLGLLVGGGWYLTLESLRYLLGGLPLPYFDSAGTMVWITPRNRTLELLLIYATTGLVYGWLYYRWVVRRQPARSKATLPATKV